MSRLLMLSAVVLAAHAELRAQTSSNVAAVRLQSFSVIVTDYDSAKTWYTEKLGFMTVRDQSFGRGERFILVAAPGQPEVGIVLQRARSLPTPDEPTMNNDYSDRVGKQTNIVLRVSSVHAYAEQLHMRGVVMTAQPKQMPWGGQATFADLYGNSFVIVGPLGVPSARTDAR